MKSWFYADDWPDRPTSFAFSRLATLHRASSLCCGRFGGIWQARIWAFGERLWRRGLARSRKGTWKGFLSFWPSCRLISELCQSSAQLSSASCTWKGWPCTLATLWSTFRLKWLVPGSQFLQFRLDESRLSRFIWQLSPQLASTRQLAKVTQFKRKGLTLEDEEAALKEVSHLLSS